MRTGVGQNFSQIWVGIPPFFVGFYHFFYFLKVFYGSNDGVKINRKDDVLEFALLRVGGVGCEAH